MATNVPGTTFEIAISGNRLYAGGPGHLRVFDTARPEEPVLVGSCLTKNSVVDICVSSNLVLTAALEAGLQIFDVQNPAQPTHIGEYDAWGFAASVEIVGNLAFVADSENGVHILDVRDPAKPRRLSRYDTPNSAFRVKVIGTTAYVADRAGIEIFDFAEPTRPKGIGRWEGNASDLHVSGKYAYAVSYYTGLSIVDISNPANPVLVGATNAVPGEGVVVRGNYAFVAGFDGYLVTIDVSEPANPFPVATNLMGSAGGFMDIAGDYLYGAGAIWNVSNPGSPIKVGQYNYGGGVSFEQGLLFVSNEATLRVFNVMDPALPVQVTNTFFPAWAYSYGLQAVGNHLFAGAGEYGLLCYSLPESFKTGPAITHQPPPQTNDLGSNAILAVNVAGQVPLFYQWYFNGDPVAEGTNWVLRLNNVQRGHAGEYLVVVSNAVGVVTSAVAGLTVKIPLQLIVNRTNAPAMRSDGQFTFSAVAEQDGNYVVEYQSVLGDSNWTVLTNLAGTAIFHIVDPGANRSQRFYRLRQVP